MTPQAVEERRRQVEWELLRALCSGVLAETKRREALALLANHNFSDPIRQAIFNEVEKIGRAPAAFLRQELPARLTRRGFPDLDFEGLFAPSPLPAERALELVRELVRAAARV